MRVFSPALAAVVVLFSSEFAFAAAPLLWQERYYFDALLQARSRQSRSESDPELIPVLRSIAGEIFQQAANLGQIDAYAKAQQGSLRYAFAQEDPGPSLKIIGLNLNTLAQGVVQVKRNLAYLMVRCRLAYSQALPDPQIYKNSLLLLSEVRRLQYELNSLYADAAASQKLVQASSEKPPRPFRDQLSFFMRSLSHLQGQVFSLYNSGYDIALRSR